MIYAGAQKNAGIAGITLVLIDERLLDRSPKHLPSMLNYASIAQSQSMINTPSTFSWYVLGLTMDWLIEQGGVESMAQRNAEKAKQLYDTIDQSDLFHNRVPPSWRSDMNVVFQTDDPSLDQRFLSLAEREGLMGLKGHRLVGGLRASLYNAMPLASVECLSQLMREFERTL